jgi:hypothetical protein
MEHLTRKTIRKAQLHKAEGKFSYKYLHLCERPDRPYCHPERSEGSYAFQPEMEKILRFAQNDMCEG